MNDNRTKTGEHLHGASQAPTHAGAGHSSHDHAAHSHGDAHGHDHSHEGQGTRVLAWAFFLTAAFMLVELVGGLSAGSLALLADAGHMLTDAAALALAWAASRIAARPPDARRSFGYRRLRVLATFVNGWALLFIVAWIAIEAVQRLLQPGPVAASTVIWIGSIGFAVNLLVFALLRSGNREDMNVAAATLHVIGDLLGSLAAILSAIIIVFTGWTAADPISSLLVCALIVRSAWSLVRRSTHILMEGTPDDVDVNELRSTLEQHIPAIRDVHHVHVWQIAPRETLMTLHVSIVMGADPAPVLRETKAMLEKRYGITHATIQIEVDECVDSNCS